jgi:hypothetical protein
MAATDPNYTETVGRGFQLDQTKLKLGETLATSLDQTKKGGRTWSSTERHQTCEIKRGGLYTVEYIYTERQWRLNIIFRDTHTKPYFFKNILLSVGSHHNYVIQVHLLICPEFPILFELHLTAANSLIDRNSCCQVGNNFGRPGGSLKTNLGHFKSLANWPTPRSRIIWLPGDFCPAESD